MFASNTRTLTFGLLALALSALACAVPGLGTTAPPPDVPPAPTAEPTLPPPPPDAPSTDVAFEGVSFSYAGALAAEVVPEIVPAEEFMGGDVIPEHVLFSFDGYILPDTLHEPRILIYPVADFQASSQLASSVITEQVQFLAEKPENPDGIPFLPLFNAAQVVRARVAYLDFQSGTGVRFLTHYSQAPIPVNNRELFYTFQGLTHDGANYVAVILPVSHPDLPPDDSAIPGDDYEAFAATFESYITEVEAQLNAADPASFTPDLATLDALVESLAIE